MAIIKIGKHCSIIEVPGIEYTFIVKPNDNSKVEYSTIHYMEALNQFKEYEMSQSFDWLRYK